MSTIAVGPLEPDLAEQALGVLGLGNHVDSGVLEQAHDPLAGEHDVVGDDYSHGISARRVVAPTSSEPPSAPTRSARWTGASCAARHRPRR